MKRKKRSRREEVEEFNDEAYVNELLYKEGYRPQKQVRRKKRSGVFFGVLIFVMSVCILALSAFLVFQTRSIEVTGTSYSMESDVLKWIQQDRYAINTLYIWYRYNYTDVELPSALEEVSVTMKSPWTAVIHVKEKSMCGYIAYNDSFLYFDRQGIASLVTNEVIPGVPFIEGMEVDAARIAMNKKLPVEDENVFEEIVEVSKLLDEYGLAPDRMACPQGDINLYFGGVTVQLGKQNFEDKLAQVPPILSKLAEQYPDQRGTLHLENFNASDKAIRFVPETVN